MKLIKSAVLIDELDPFKHDQLNRKSSAEILSALVESLEEPFVMSIEAGWGHGKTTFLRMWLQHLKNTGFTALSFNAWENDFVVDPLIPFISEITSAIEKGNPETEAATKRKALVNQLKKIGIQVAKRSVPVAAKLLTAGLLSEDTFADAGKTAADAIGKVVEEKFADFDAEQSSLEQFRKGLEELLSSMEDNSRKLPLIFIVDELDRCRPPFAIALLERLKHLFSVRGIAFVLAIDKPQLLSSVRAIYGGDTDAHRYLRRFIDLEYTLPEPDPRAFASFLMSQHGFKEGFPRITHDAYADKQFLDTFVMLSLVFGMRLRDQEHAFNILAIVWRTLRPGENLSPFIAALLVGLKVGAPKIYEDFVSHRMSFDDLIKTLRSHPAGAAFVDADFGAVFEAFILVYSQDETFITQRLDKILQDGSGTGAPVSHVKRMRIMKNVIEEAPHGGRRAAFDKIVRRIQMTELFFNPAA